MNTLTAPALPTDAPAAEADAHHWLDRLHHRPDDAGDWIYDGDVFAMTGAAAPLFRYQRRIAAQRDGGLRATHLTHDAAGRAVIAEAAGVDAAYALQRFDAVNLQQRFSGRVDASADGRWLHYTLQRDGRTRRRSERIAAPAVTGPSLHGFIAQQRTRIAAGPLAVRFVVLAQCTSYPFEISRDKGAAAGVDAYVITPARWWLRLAIRPLRVEFDAASGRVLRYVGRVPPMLEGGGRLKALDARVQYVRHAAAYR